MPLGTLSSHILENQKNLKWEFKKQMMLDLCEGMEFLHSCTYPTGKKKREVFHQDIKSQNVLLCKEEGVIRGKISDFGLALIRESLGEEDASTVAYNGGTKNYLAPELLTRTPSMQLVCNNCRVYEKV